MNKVELTKIPGLQSEDKVIIWKMNYGFRSDLQGEISSMSVEQKGGKMDAKATMDVRNLRILNLVFGILESPALGITIPKNLAMGLEQEEKDQRIGVVRNLEGDVGSFIFKKIIALNKEPKEELKKN